MATLLRQVTLLWLFIIATVLQLHAQPKIDPKSPLLKTLPELGRMVGTGSAAGFYGRQIARLGDIDHDNLADWCVSVYRTDTALVPPAMDLLVYRGVAGKLPTVESGQRIGPTELASSTRFLAVGDWDSDGHIDLATEISLRGDTSAGNTNGLEIGRVIVWWGNDLGEYSLDDTTQLSSGTQVWGGVRMAVGNLQFGNGVDNLLLWTWGQGMSNGQIINHAQMLLYRGQSGKRWGSDGVPRTAEWSWWTPPKFTQFYSIDQNCDGAPDLVMPWEEKGGYAVGQLAMIYGIPGGGMPDTSAVVTLDLSPVNGHNALLSDVTGDGVCELLVVTMDELVKVYAGEPGVRLLELFGSGDDPADPEQGRIYRRPWAELPLPRRLNNGFALSGVNPLLALGDAGLNGTNDIWVYNRPFIIAYTTGKHGEGIDSLFDGIIFPAGEQSLTAVVMGDIDGTGVPTIGLGFRNGNHVQFIKPTREVPENAFVYRTPFHGDGIRCQSTSSIDEAATEQGKGSTRLDLQAVPNPATGEVRLRWQGEGLASEVTITIRDLLGHEVAHWSVGASQQQTAWATEGMVGGAYFITLTIGERSDTTRVIVR